MESADAHTASDASTSKRGTTADASRDAGETSVCSGCQNGNPPSSNEATSAPASRRAASPYAAGRVRRVRASAWPSTIRDIRQTHPRLTDDEKDSAFPLPVDTNACANLRLYPCSRRGVALIAAPACSSSLWQRAAVLPPPVTLPSRARQPVAPPDDQATTPRLEKLFHPPPHAPRLLHHHHHAGPAPARHHHRILAPRPGGAPDGDITLGTQRRPERQPRGGEPRWRGRLQPWSVLRSGQGEGNPP